MSRGICRHKQACRGEKRKGPGAVDPGAKEWWAFAARSYRCTTLGASPWRAVCFPTPLSAARRMFRSHGGTVPIVAGREFSSEAFAPGSVASCRKGLAGRGIDASAIRTSRRCRCYRVGPGSHRALAPHHGSGLLSLRLRSVLQRSDAFLAPPRGGGFPGFAKSVPPSLTPSLCVLFGGCRRAFRQGCPAGNACASWSSQ
jgi:hypothetical protein